jgi:hypothetical protein
MAETIEGGAFLGADGKTFHDANGQPLKSEDAAKAKKLADEQGAATEEAEVRLLEMRAQADPVARALQGFVQRTATPAKSSKD